MKTWMLLGVLGILGLGAGVGCGSSGGSAILPGPRPNTLAVDFTLGDVNPASPTGGEAVSVRDQIGRISVWYFGTAT